MKITRFGQIRAKFVIFRRQNSAHRRFSHKKRIKTHAFLCKIPRKINTNGIFLNKKGKKIALF
jgi:hypothetical protein